MNLHPHKVRYWIHSTKKAEDPKSFVWKVNEICEIYRNAQEFSREGSHVTSIDEMTAIQVLKHKYSDKLPRSGQFAKMEFEYICHSTTSLIGFLT